jgi:hypothetical protein
MAADTSMVILDNGSGFFYGESGSWQLIQQC